VISSLSGEDVFLERLVPPYYEQARSLLREKSRNVDHFVAMNAYYANYMAEYLDVERARISVIPHGLNLAGHAPPAAARSRNSNRVVVGYFARICHDKGLHLLAEAYLKLLEDSSLPPVELHVAGYLGSGDRRYFAAIHQRLQRAAPELYQHHGELSREAKIEFLQQLDIMALPTVYRESKGLSVLEAMANGVPVVVPDHGVFPELIADTQGGLLCQPEDAASLACRLRELILDEPLRARLGRQAHAAIHHRYRAEVMADRTREMYHEVRSGRTAASDLPSHVG
jgi:glycosyltransferase involved in cell wall biosynthesis